MSYRFWGWRCVPGIRTGERVPAGVHTLKVAIYRQWFGIGQNCGERFPDTPRWVKARLSRLCGPFPAEQLVLSLLCLSPTSQLWLKVQQRLNIKFTCITVLIGTHVGALSVVLISQFIKILYNQYLVHYQTLSAKNPQKLFLLREQDSLWLSCFLAISFLKRAG